MQDRYEVHYRGRRYCPSCGIEIRGASVDVDGESWCARCGQDEYERRRAEQESEDE